jgi:serine O-acetyltransferase
MFHIAEDIRCALKRDPAATNALHVFLFWPGLHAIWAYRLAHALWRAGVKPIALFIALGARALTGIEIHPGAQIGRRFFIDHGMGVVIGETTEIASDVTLYHGVTLGGVSPEPGKRHPTVESGVVIGAGAKVLGALVIGENTRIGANAVVVKDIPPESVVVGIPGKAIRPDRQKRKQPDLDHGDLPDIVTEQLRYVYARLNALEEQAGVEKPPPDYPDLEYYI